MSQFGRSEFHSASQLTAEFVTAARTVCRVVDEGLDTGRRILLPMKNNVSIDCRGLAFRIKEVGGFVPAPRVLWETK